MRRALMMSGVLALAALGLPAVATAAASAAPSPVARLAVTTQTSTSITLHWTPHTADAGDAVEIREARGTATPSSPTAGTHVTRVTHGRHTITIPRLTPGARYGFSLFTVDTHDHYSPPASLHALTAPAAVTDLAAYQSGTAIRITWNLPHTATFTHVIARYAQGDAAPATPTAGHAIRLSSTHSRTATLTGLRRNTRYSVSVFALDHAARASTTALTRFTTTADPTHDGTLTGRVTDTNGTPLQGADVSLYQPADNSFDDVLSGADGRWSLSLLAGPAEFYVDGSRAAGGNSDTGGYLSVDRGVNLTAGRSVDLGDTVLGRGAALTGTVTDADGHGKGGVGLNVDTVSAYVIPDGADGGIGFGDASFPDLTTSPDGSYTITGLSPATALRVCTFRPLGDYAAECTPTETTGAANTSTTVPTVALRAPLGSGGIVTGHVRDQHGRGVAGAEVSVQSEDNGLGLSTSAGGGFVLSGLAPGRYQLCAQGDGGSTGTASGYAPRCSATFVVTVGARVQRDIGLLPGAALTGTVTGPSGHPLAGVEVSVQAPDSADGSGASSGPEFFDSGFTTTDASGHYTVSGMSAGPVTACADSLDRPEHGLPTGTRSVCGPDLRVRAGLVRTGGDLRAKAGAAITGQVVDTAGTPVAGADVQAARVADEDGFGGDDATSGADGRYTIAGLDPGQYGVCAALSPEDPELGNGVQGCMRHSVMTVAGRSVAAKVTLPVSATIHLTVADTDGNPLVGVDAAALTVCGRFADEDCQTLPIFDPKLEVSAAASAVTDASGAVTLHVLAAGRYAVCGFAFYATTQAGGSPTGYGDTCTAPASTVTLTAGQSADVHLVLGIGGVISGRVTDPAGHPLKGAHPFATGSAASDYPGAELIDDPFAGFPGDDAVTGADGTFTLIGVRPGTSDVCVSADGVSGGSSRSGYVDLCPTDEDTGDIDYSGATTVTVTAGATTQAGDVHLIPASTISGTVRTGTGHVLRDAIALVVGKNNEQVGDGSQTDSHGRWDSGPLPPGTYRVCFAYVRGADSDTPDVVAQCWRNVAWSDPLDNPPPLSHATAVVTTAGHSTTGIDGRLKINS